MKTNCERCGRMIPSKRRTSSDFCTDRCADEQHYANRASAASELDAQRLTDEGAKDPIDVRRKALACVTATLLDTGKAPTMAQLRDHLGLKSRNSAHTIVLALEAAGEIVVTRFAISLPGAGPATYEEGLSDGRAQGLASLDVLPGEEAWARSVMASARPVREHGANGGRGLALLEAASKST